MTRGNGKNKFYRQLDLPKDVMKLIKHYNKILKPQALKEMKVPEDGSTR